MRQPPLVVTTSSEFDEMLARLAEQPRVAVDTEADSLYSYYEKVCLIQFSIPNAAQRAPSTRSGSIDTADYILDTLTFRQIEPLGALFADPRIELVFHAAEYDIMSLRRDYGFEFASIFDTMAAARILGWKHVGLGNILEQHFGVKLDKRFQRADWGKRPLSPELIEYARDDTHYLLALHDLQRADLEARGRLDEARAEFERLERVAWGERAFDPNRYVTLEGARGLNPAELGALRELFQMRETLARKEDRPPFKVIANAVLVRVARVQPRTLAELTLVPGVGEWYARRYGRETLKAIERGRAHPQARPPKPGTRRAPQLPDNASRERYNRLKAWRRERALARGVEPDVILSNDALVEIARANPRTPDALPQLTALGEWKAREYGEELLKILKG